jgi:RND family efflux transporter MFP subunit
VPEASPASEPPRFISDFGFRISDFGFTPARLALTLLLLSLALLLSGCGGSGPAASGGKFICPMHPTYTSDRPGDCPICNMKLVPVKTESTTNSPAAATTNAASAKVARYHCPMHPTYTSPGPGECPICNMDLVPIPTDKAGGSGGGIPGVATVALSADKQQLIGLRTSVVGKRALARTVRASATLEHDERKLTKIAPRFGGWVVSLKVNQTGQEVTKGDPLLTVYSPEMYSAENEYLLAWQRVQQLKAAAAGSESDQARALLDSATRRLRLLGIGDAEIAALEKAGRPEDEILLRAPASGHVITRRVTDGQSFMPGEVLFEIGAMSPLWARAYIYEADLAALKPGDAAEVTVPFLPNQHFATKVDFIYPHIDPQTRRAEIRLEVANPDHELRPNMWAEVTITADASEVLTVPASAVIDSGRRCVAFVVKPDDHFEPREVKVGLRDDDYWQVLGGLAEGERVVTRALFLLDAESQLKAAVAGMTETAETAKPTETDGSH